MTSHKMSAAKGHRDEEFRKYREAAPEGVDDAVIRALITKHAGNTEAIATAIENMWHDLPDRQAVGSEWMSTSKPKKGQEIPQAQNNSSGGRGKGRGQQSAGRGSSSGRGDRAGSRAINSGAPSRSAVQRQSSSISTVTAATTNNEQDVPSEAAASTSSTTAAVNASSSKAAGIWGASNMNLAQKLKLAEEQKKTVPPPAAATALTTAGTTVDDEDHKNGAAAGEDAAAAGGDKGGKGKNKNSRTRKPKSSDDKEEDTIKDEIKIEEIVSVAADSLAEQLSLQVDVVVDVAAAVDVVETISSPLETPPAPQAPPGLSAPEPISSAEHASAVLQDPSPPKAFLKMGKWEAPPEASTSAFQFGSFGNFGDDKSITNSAPGWANGVVAEPLSTQQSVQPSSIQTSQQQPAEAAWSNGGVNAAAPLADLSQSSASGTNAAIGSLFQQQKALVDSAPTATAAQGAARFDQKPSAPPGLEQHNANTAQNRAAAVSGQPRGKHEGTQQQLLQPQYQQPQYQQQQQPPGILPPANRAAIPAIPYGYAPAGFDLAQSQYLPHSYPPAAPVVATPVAGAAAGASGATASQGSSATPQAQQQQQQQQQQQYAPPPGMPAPYGYYGNPYYANQAYYFTQPQNFYGQGRGVYQPPRGPYGSDPYGSGASIYPDVYQTGGQFADSTGSYGGIPMHPSMNLPTATTQGSAGVSGAAGKQQKGGSGVTAATPPQQQQQQQQQSHMAPEHAGYGYYNPRADASSWQYQQPAAQSWPGMMGFPGVSPTGAPGQPVQNFAQQNVPAQQQQQPQGAGGQRGPTGGSNYASSQQSFPRGGTATSGSASGTAGNTW